jgi:hypothetical protein
LPLLKLGCHQQTARKTAQGLGDSDGLSLGAADGVTCRLISRSAVAVVNRNIVTVVQVVGSAHDQHRIGLNDVAPLNILSKDVEEPISQMDRS